MVKVKIFLAENSNELESEINQFLAGLHASNIVDIQFRRDTRSVLQYSAYITYDAVTKIPTFKNTNPDVW